MATNASPVAAPAAPATPPAESSTITLRVTDPALIAEIDGWIDGEAYSFNANRTTANKFDVTDAFAAEVEEEAPVEDEVLPAKSGNPAIANLLAKEAV